MLIAEDEPIVRLDLKEILEQAGFEVCAEAGNGEDAVRLAREVEPELAVLDVRMPEMSGIEAVRRILAERPIPVVMLTAFADSRTVSEAVKAGVFAYVVKPFREQDLLPAIETAFARHREWLESRRERGRTPERVGRASEPIEVVVGDGRWPLRIERQEDGSLEVTPLPSSDDQSAKNVRSGKKIAWPK